MNSQPPEPGQPVCSARVETLFIAALAAVSLYSAVLKWPLVAIWRLGDESIFLWHAEEMLHGRALYRDMFQFNLPGTEVLYYLMFRCFGVHLWIEPLAVLAAATASTALTFALSRKVLSGPAAYLPALMFLFAYLPFHLWGTHHIYSTPLVLLAVWIVAGGTGWKRLSAAGVVAALATVFTSDRGVFTVLGIAAFLIWYLRGTRQRLKALGALLLPFAAVVGGTLAYLVHVAGAATIYESIFVFPLRYYPAAQHSNDFGAFWVEFLHGLPADGHSAAGILQIAAAAVTLLFCIGAAIVPVLFTVRALGVQRGEYRASGPGKMLVLYALVGCFLVLAEMHSANSSRLGAAVPFALVIATYWLSSKMQSRTIIRLLIAGVVLGLLLPLYRYSHAYGRLETTRGPVALTGNILDEFSARQRMIPPGACYIADPDVNFVLGFKNPTPVSVLTPDEYTRPEQVQAVIAALEKNHQCYVEWNWDFDQPRENDNLSPLRAYLHEHYRQMLGGEFTENTLERKEDNGGPAEDSGQGKGAP